MKDTGSKKTKKSDKELKDSEEVYIHRHKGVSEETSEELLRSSGIQKRGGEPQVQVTSDQAAIKKQKELSAMKAKLLGKI